MALARDALDEKEREKGKPTAKLGGAGGGAATGASVGALGGPVGAVIGGGIGAIAGAADANRAEKKAASSDPNRPRRRRLQKGMDIAKETKSRKERALATLSQAVFDWASAIR